MKCPVCDGIIMGTDLGEGTFIPDDCPYCKDTLKVPLTKWLKYQFWERAPEWLFDLYVWLVYPREIER